MNRFLLKKATREFNRYRFPESYARTVVNKNGLLKIRFSGIKATFACCFAVRRQRLCRRRDENFEDYRYYLKDITGIDYKLKQVKKINDKFIVTYRRKL